MARKPKAPMPVPVFGPDGQLNKTPRDKRWKSRTHEQVGVALDEYVARFALALQALEEGKTKVCLGIIQDALVGDNRSILPFIRERLLAAVSEETQTEVTDYVGSEAPALVGNQRAKLIERGNASAAAASPGLNFFPASKESDDDE